MNRLVQNADKALIDVEDYLKEQVQKIHKYQIATKEFFKGFLESKMLDAYREGFIDMNKQFLTIGINGLLESAEYKGCKIGNNEEYKEYTSRLLRVIFEENRRDREFYKNSYWSFLQFGNKEYKIFSNKILKVKNLETGNIENKAFKDIDFEKYSIEEGDLENASGRLE